MRLLQLLSVMGLSALFFSCGQGSVSDNKKDESTLTLVIERNHGMMDTLFPEGTEVEVLGSGFEWTEGPLWVEQHQMLLFSEIPTNTVHQWTASDGMKPYLNPSGYTGGSDRGGETGSNGLLLGPDGSLVLCQHGDRQMARMKAPLDSPKPEYETVVGKYSDQRLNSPNDAVYDSRGNLFFTDPPYGLEKNIDDPAKEIPFQGVYRYNEAGDELTLLLDSLTRPNGIAFLPGEASILVANSDPKKPYWYIYRVTDDGKLLTDGEIFHDSSDALASERGLPDGLKVSRDGIVYATGPGGVWVFDLEGTVLGKLKVGELTSNVALDAAERYLYITADSYIIRVPIRDTSKI